MSTTIDFAIDLGTTNSLISKFAAGNVEVFSDPGQGRKTLPSVVGFRKERILVGCQAKVFLEKEPENAVSRFKRKMGTTESFRINSLQQSKTPVDLSAIVLKELKTFVHTGEVVDAAVITVPASFDVVQSNDTREAGKLAGFKQVVLLQEPIAASLAFANKHNDRDLNNSQWLVYDLGGGTFDVALVKVVDGELKVRDHEGDNFLGGMDFDTQIVEQLFVPALERKGTFKNLLPEMKSASGKHNGLWYALNHKAEEAKIGLSTKPSAFVDFAGLKDDADEELDFELPVTRSEFEALLKPSIDRTVDMIRAILTRNSLQAGDVQFVLMVGGSTYIPYVRRRVEELLQIRANCEIDPVTAVVEGAAYFASMRERKLEQSPSPVATDALRVKAVFNRGTKESEEMFAAKVDGPIEGLSYRITREDGGFDTGTRTLQSRITEDLPLRQGEYNQFTLRISDRLGNAVPHDLGPIQIAQGMITPPAGQPASHDISLVVDDFTQERTRCECLFAKNQLLPARKTKTVTANKTVLKGSEDFIWIKVIEGDHNARPESINEIGVIQISGNQLESDLYKGSDIELLVEFSESRELTVSAFVSSINQSFEKTFTPKHRAVDVEMLQAEVKLLHDKIGREIEEAKQIERYEVAAELTKLQKQTQELERHVTPLCFDDVTDDRGKLAERKQELARGLDALTKDKKVEQLRAELNEAKQSCGSIVAEHGNDHERKAYDDLIRQERGFASSGDPRKIQQQIDMLQALELSILRRTPAFLVGTFNNLASQRERFNDQSQAKSLIDAGKSAAEGENFDRLDEIIVGLINLLPREERADIQRSFTGISSN